MSRAAFGRGIVLVVAVFIALAGVVHLANRGHHRPEGVAEDWLEAVGDTTRKGVHDEAVRRAGRMGPVSLAANLLGGLDTDGHRAFDDLEVGKAHGVRVPFLLHRYNEDVPRIGVVVVDRGRVLGVAERQRGFDERVPSEGGPPPSSAPGVLWVGGLLAGLVMTALCSLAVRAASPEPV